MRRATSNITSSTVSSKGLVWRGAGRAVPIEFRPDPRARSISLRADPASGTIRITLHPRTSANRALALLETHEAWLTARVARWPQPRPFVPGGTIPFDGRDILIDWAATLPRAPRLDGSRLLVGGPVESLPGRITRFLRAEAQAALEAETRVLAERIGRKVASVAVRDTRGRWGSCSATGAIGYSWRLILAPAAVRSSVVAHEVAHLVHLNHSADFWELATALYGADHKRARRWLAAHGAGLHWVGRSA